MKTEEILVILLGQLTTDVYTKNRLFHILKGDIDWYEFLKISIKTKTICLAYYNLYKLGLINILPLVIRNNMKYHYEQNLQHNMRLTNEMTSLNQIFHQNEIQYAFVNGYSLLNSLYMEAKGTRILTDIDIIVDGNQKSRIDHIMSQSGYHLYLTNNVDLLYNIHGKIDDSFFVRFYSDNVFSERLNIDFNFSSDMNMINNLNNPDNHMEEFTFMCKRYYKKSQGDINNIMQENLMRLIDLHEYYNKYLLSDGKDKIINSVSSDDIKKEIMFCFDSMIEIYPEQ